MTNVELQRILRFAFLLLMVGLTPISMAQMTREATGVRLFNTYDAFGKQRPSLTQDFGFSCVIEYNDKKILFDAGTNTKFFEQNVKALKIDLKKIDIAVLSHGHYDHMHPRTAQGIWASLCSNKPLEMGISFWG